MYRLNIPYILIHNKDYAKYNQWCYNSKIFNPNLLWSEFANLDLTEIIYDRKEYNRSSTISWNTIINNPTCKWDYAELSRRQDITWDIVCANPQIKWNYSALSCHPNITWEIIRNNIDKPWNWQSVSCNPNITLNIIESNPQIYWWYDAIIERINCPFEFIKKHGDYYHIAKHKDTSINDILSWYGLNSISEINGDIYKNYYYDIMLLLSINPNITRDIIINNKHLRWYYLSIKNDIRISFGDIIPHTETTYYYISCYTGITLDDIYNNQHIKWDYEIIHWRKDLTWEYIQSHPNFPWNYEILSLQHRNVNYSYNYNDHVKRYGLKFLRSATDYVVSWKDIVNNPDKPWNYVGLSERDDLTIEFVKEHPNIPWSYVDLLGNPNIDQDGIMYIINNYKHKIPLGENYNTYHGHPLGLNPNLTWQMIIELTNTFTFYTKDLVANRFHQHPHLIKKRLMRKYFNRWTAILIKKYWANIHYCVIHEYKLKFNIINHSY